MTELEVTTDTLLGGRVRLTQPVNGYRVSIDAVLVAAAVGAQAGQRALDVGCGVGGATLCLASRVAGLDVHGIDQDASLIDTLRGNAELNGLGGCVTGEVADVGAGPPDQLRSGFDHVFSNPPYLPAERADTRGGASASDTANIETVPLNDWCSFMAACAKPAGRITLVHRADRIDELVAAVSPLAGELRFFPLWPRTGTPAKRIIVTARVGAGSPTSLCPGLILHEEDGTYTSAARAVLEEGAALDLP